MPTDVPCVFCRHPVVQGHHFTVWIHTETGEQTCEPRYAAPDYINMQNIRRYE